MNSVVLKKKVIQTCLALFLSLLTLACSSSATTGEQAEEVSVKAEVLTLQPETATVEQAYPAGLEGKINVEIRPQISGYIDKIYVDEGAYVKAGQPLFQINASVYREQKNTAMASLEVAKSQLASAKLDLDKYELLSEKKVVADFQYQKAKSTYESAKAAVSQQQAMLASSDLNLGFTIVKAPVSGYIGRIPKRIGTLVSPADAQALTTLSQVDVVYAYFSMPETEILKISASREGNTLLQKLQTFKDVVFQMADGNAYQHTGKIDMMDGQFDKGTGSVTLRASFPNPEGLFRTGNTGRIILSSQQSDIFKIPVLATYEMQDKLFVGLVGNHNEMQRVELKNYRKSGDYYLVKEGLKAGDKIVARELGSIPEKAIIATK